MIWVSHASSGLRPAAVCRREFFVNNAAWRACLWGWVFFRFGRPTGPRVVPCPDGPTFYPGWTEPITLPVSTYWVLRLPLIYWGESIYEVV